MSTQLFLHNSNLLEYFHYLFSFRIIIPNIQSPSNYSYQIVLTVSGRIQAVDASKTLEEMGFLPTYIWASNTERSYETAAIIARESQLGQNRYFSHFFFLLMAFQFCCCHSYTTTDNTDFVKDILNLSYVQ